jgi:hypothetical protein
MAKDKTNLESNISNYVHSEQSWQLESKYTRVHDNIRIEQKSMNRTEPSTTKLKY